MRDSILETVVFSGSFRFTLLIYPSFVPITAYLILILLSFAMLFLTDTSICPNSCMLEECASVITMTDREESTASRCFLHCFGRLLYGPFSVAQYTDCRRSNYWSSCFRSRLRESSAAPRICRSTSSSLQSQTVVLLGEALWMKLFLRLSFVFTFSYNQDHYTLEKYL